MSEDLRVIGKCKYSDVDVPMCDLWDEAGDLFYLGEDFKDYKCGTVGCVMAQKEPSPFTGDIIVFFLSACVPTLSAVQSLISA